MIGRDLALALAERFGTPLFVYDLDQIDERCAELRALLPADAALFYSLKANPLPAVAAAARGAGCRAEISSEGELAAALEAGFDPSALLFTGPAKGWRELERAFACGVGCFSAESWRDLEQIAASARRASARARVILRVNPAAAPRAGLAMTGVPSQFGIDEEEIGSVGARSAGLSGVDVLGIHAFLGTQVVDAAALADAFAVAIAAAERLAAVLAVRVVDLGGGFPWPFATPGRPPDLAPLAAALSAQLAARRRASGAELWFESGRYVAASCGTLLARVVEVKRSRGTTFVLLDAGVSTLGGMSGLGRLLRPVASLLPVERGASGASWIADVVGPLCTPLDCLARAVAVPDVRPGELVAVPNVGAYGATASLSGFLSRPPALEISLRAGRVVDAARLRSGHERVPIPQELA